MSQMTQTLPSTQDLDSEEFEVGNSSIVEDAWGRFLPSNGKIKPVDLTELVYTFGRGEECSITIPQHEVDKKYFLAISKTHFKVSREESGSDPHVFLEDLSSNGTFINGEKVGKGKKRVLKNNDEIGLAFHKHRVFVYLDTKSSEESNLPAEIRQKYTFTRLLGKGACGEVRLAFSKENCDRVAIKIISKKRFTVNGINQVEQLDQQNQVLNEIKLLRELCHPCIIGVHDVVETDDYIFLVIELVEGGELFDLVSTRGRLEEEHAKFLFYQMVLAVKYLHDSGVTHRDLKPENILLSSDDKDCLVKVTDFGLSKLIEGSKMMKTLCGTPNYLAPEVLRSFGKSSYTNAIDCWSLGVILFICLSGYPPFSPDYKDLPLPQQILTGRYSFVPKYWSRVSADAKDIVKKLLVVNPEQRLTLDQALRHPWLSDAQMHEKVKKLMYPGGTCPPSPAEEGANGKRGLDVTSDMPSLKRIRMSGSTPSPTSS